MSTGNESNSGPEAECNREPAPFKPDASLPESADRKLPNHNPRRRPIIVEQLEVPATITLILINVAVFCLMIATAHSPALLSVSGETMIAWGANFGPLSGTTEPWRMFTAIFLHVGFLHIIVNMWALWSLRTVERFFGSLRYFVLYLLSGFAGSCATLIFSPVNITAGASAALFGVMGGMLGYATLQKRISDNPVYRNLQVSVLKTVVVNIAIILLIPRLERAGSATGLVFGTFAGLLLAPLPIRFIPLDHSVRAVVGTLGCAVLLILTAHVTLDRTANDNRVVTYAAAKDFDDFIDQMRPILQENEKNTSELNELLNTPVINVPKDRVHALAVRGDEALQKIDAMGLQNFGVQKLHQLLLNDVASLAKTIHAFEGYVNERRTSAREMFKTELQKSNAAVKEFDEALKAYKAENGLNKDDDKSPSKSADNQKKQPGESPKSEQEVPQQTF